MAPRPVRLLPFTIFNFAGFWTCIWIPCRGQHLAGRRSIPSSGYNAMHLAQLVVVLQPRCRDLIKSCDLEPIWISCVLASIRLRLLWYRDVMYQC